MRDRFVFLLCLINLRNKRDDNKEFKFFLWFMIVLLNQALFMVMITKRGCGRKVSLLISP